jgi:CheY-like chemotaxis protein
MMKGSIPIILVVEDVEETRDGIEKLLKADGYRVDPARDEADAVVRASRAHPNLILVSLGESAANMIATALRIRKCSDLSECPGCDFLR